MIFTPTTLKDAFLVDLKRIEDQRGFFARGWCLNEFTEHGIGAPLMQSNIGFSLRAGTVRGLHFQDPPHQEAKLVRCTRGAMFDVIVDLRPESPTFKRWFGVELTADNRRMLYVPEGFGQGYQTLEDDTEMYYHTTRLFAPSSARGVRYNDPAFKISWPLPVSVISEPDRSWPDFQG